MCSIVYGEVFRPPLPKLNGRRRQDQAGVDVYVRSAIGRVSLQRKKYKDGSLKLKHVTDEIEKAEVGPVKIVLLIVATTAANDAKLLAEAIDGSNREGIYQFLARTVLDAKPRAIGASAQQLFPFETGKSSRIPELRLARSSALLPNGDG